MLGIFTRRDNQWWGQQVAQTHVQYTKPTKGKTKKVSSLTLAMLGESVPRSDLTATVDLVQVVRYSLVNVAAASQSRITKV